MRKTGAQVETDIYKSIKESIKANINGDVYTSSGRPTDSKKEDAVIIFMTGRDGQIQEGVVVVNVFVPDIYPATEKGRSVKDTKRCREIEIALAGITDSMTTPEYQIYREDMIQTYKNQDRDEHFINARLSFQRIE